MFFSSLPGAVVFWAVVVFGVFLKTGRWRLRFSFSIRNYYLLMCGFLFSPIYRSLALRSVKPLTMFVIFAVAGVIGESLFSVWWHVFYEKKFWTYKVETLIHSYTSWLNLIPWGLGGILYLNILVSH